MTFFMSLIYTSVQNLLHKDIFPFYVPEHHSRMVVVLKLMESYFIVRLVENVFVHLRSWRVQVPLMGISCCWVPEASGTICIALDYKSYMMPTVLINVAKLSHCLCALYYIMVHCGCHYRMLITVSCTLLIYCKFPVC